MSRLWKQAWKIGALVFAIVLIPTAALAVVGTFTSNTTTPAVTGTNSSAAAGAPGVLGTNTGGGLNTRYGVQGTANGTAGVGVWGTGTKYGVFSNGPLGVASGKFLTCVAVTGCVGAGALLSNSVTNAKLANGSVTNAKLAAGSVDVSNLTTAAQRIQPLASGQSESGAYGAGDGDGAGGGTGYEMTGVTYTQPLTSPLSHGFEDTFSGTTTECPGAGSAAPGWLCFYPFYLFNSPGFTCATFSTAGAPCYFLSSGGGAYEAGTYTVTDG